MKGIIMTIIQATNTTAPTTTRFAIEVYHRGPKAGRDG